MDELTLKAVFDRLKAIASNVVLRIQWDGSSYESRIYCGSRTVACYWDPDISTSVEGAVSQFSSKKQRGEL